MPAPSNAPPIKNFGSFPFFALNKPPPREEPLAAELKISLIRFAFY
jgi:hypothetical protein